MNGIYIRSKSISELAEIVTQQLEYAGILKPEDTSFSEEYIYRFIELMQERVKTVNEFVESGKFFFIDPDQYDPDAVKKHFTNEGVGDHLTQLIQRLSGLKKWNEERIEFEIRGLAEELGVGAGKIIHPARVALTGASVSPGLFEMMALLGCDTVEKRLNRAYDFILTL